MTKAIFVDKDGVLNQLVSRSDGKMDSPKTIGELQFYNGIVTAVEKAHLAGFKLYVISNQADASTEFLEYQDTILRHIYGFDGVMFARQRGSVFYKPNPGMIEELTYIYDVDLRQSWMIGDRWKDAVAARLANVRYVHIKGEDPITCFYAIADNFPIAIEYILSEAKFDKRIFN